MKWLFSLFSGVHEFLLSPLKVFLVCLAFALVNLVFDGTLLRLWGLHRDLGDIHHQSQQLKVESEKLEQKLEMASDLSFIERQARDRFDLVGEGDIVFLFHDDQGL